MRDVQSASSRTRDSASLRLLRRLLLLLRGLRLLLLLHDGQSGDRYSKHVECGISLGSRVWMGMVSKRRLSGRIAAGSAKP